MKNKIVTLLCIMAILITTAIAAFASQDEIRRVDVNDTEAALADLIEQQLNGQAFSDYDHDVLLTPGRYLDYGVSVKNADEATPVYVRTVFAFEAGDLSLEAFHEALHIELNQETYESNGAYIQYWDYFDDNEWLHITYNGVNYYMLVATYTMPLSAVTVPSLKSIGLEYYVSSETADQFGDDGYSVMIETQAVQAEGWNKTDSSVETINEILDFAWGNITSENHPWSD